MQKYKYPVVQAQYFDSNFLASQFVRSPGSEELHKWGRNLNVSHPQIHFEMQISPFT